MESKKQLKKMLAIRRKELRDYCARAKKALEKYQG